MYSKNSFYAFAFAVLSRVQRYQINMKSAFIREIVAMGKRHETIGGNLKEIV